MTKLEQLTELLADKTLDFGCRVICQKCKKREWHTILNGTGKGWFCTDNMGVADTGKVHFKFKKVIGHPATLARVLEMMSGLDLDWSCFVNTHWRMTFENRLEKTQAHWDLKHDNLSQQSQDTIDFLDGIFFKK